MAKPNETRKKKIICPHCKGNGYVRIPYHLAKEEITARCGVCESEGEIHPEEVDNIIVDSDGIHRIH
tara:strand:+ start:216 stop:416 length:201 start_codon:yes stop_codon:yes gene_type:complete